MKKLLFPIILLLILLSSCDIFMEDNAEDRKLYLVAIGLGYQMNPRITHLDNTYNDFRGIVEQFETLSEMAGIDYEITTYSDFASKKGNITFGFDHTSDKDGRESIFNEKTGRMRTPELIEYDNTSRESVIDSFIKELRNTFERESKPSENDLIIFYYTGHGTEKGGPVIHHSADKDRIYTDITYEEIEDRFLSQYDARSIVIIDCCYSGRAIDNSELGSTLGFAANKDVNGNPSDKLDRNPNGSFLNNAFDSMFSESNPLPKIFYLTASTDRQMSYEYDIYQNGWNSDKYGAFTYQILKCWGYDTENMRKAFPVSRKGTSITLGNMYSYIRENMSTGNREKSTPSLTRSRFDVTIFDFN